MNKKINKKNYYLINEFIKTKYILFINKEKQIKNIINIKDGIKYCSQENKDLIKIGVTNIEEHKNLPVCICENINKYLYQQKKKHKNTKTNILKSLTLRSCIEIHDLNVKINKIVLFLTKKHTVKLKIIKSYTGVDKEYMYETIKNKIKNFINYKTIEYKIISNKIATINIFPK